ncbi:Putative porin [Halopseudomonas litoralis]|uniref:Putative porin n=1 Tax=Halopseudomonas litoralis TaxID=797277 RepID=A0A1H1Q8Q0_9GAMM|nr:putative porin [Halopseudomonas litoralis]SDS19289.1 Putative porin [Halopseudomonas litoralis]
MNFQPNRLAAVVAVTLALSAGHSQAQAPSENATINLIRLLVQQGVLPAEQADALVRQAEQEALQAREQTQQGGAVAGGAVAGGVAVEAGDVRVPYIPETVRDQIRDEVKSEVIAQAKSENWATPNTFPDWVSRIKFEGDVRVRNESRFFDGANSNEILDYQEYNASGPYNVNENVATQLPPLLNTLEDRKNRLRIRARFGLTAALSEHWSAGIRVATGSDDSPVSTTQTLGGGMSKKDIWLDQSWLRWQSAGGDNVTLGRASNPFVSTDMIYSNDLNFDGVSATIAPIEIADDFALFGTLGAFALEYSSDSWPSNSMDKGESEDKWLFGGQLGAQWKINNENQLRSTLAYYHFDNIEGQRSSTCYLYEGDPACDTDWSRPAFMQKGNSLFLLRDIALDPTDPAMTPLPQYVGLASEFNVLDLNMIWDTSVFDNLKMRLHGNYIVNLAYDERDMMKRTQGQIINNFDDNDEFESGDTAWMLHATLGNQLDRLKTGDWNVFAGYKYIEPDALPDAYNDSSFHLGGTNAKGYFLGGSYGLDENVYALGRWISTDEVYGSPLSINLLQVELNARF